MFFNTGRSLSKKKNGIRNHFEARKTAHRKGITGTEFPLLPKRVRLTILNVNSGDRGVPRELQRVL